MDGTLDEWTQKETVDIETRAIVSSLVTALGGTSIEQHGRYVLGDDALACLKDLRRWIKIYDERIDRLDVKRVLAESNLVRGDLLEILAGWSQSDKKNRLKTKISLKCLELLVPLTWPLEIEDHMMKINHHRHVPYLRLAQVEYKRAILHHDIAKILRTVIELAVPYMLMPKKERSAHDEGVIRLAIILFRNMALTEQPSDLPSDGNENEVSRSATIDAFHAQGVLPMISTIASSIGEEYIIQDVDVLEFLFHTLKGIDPQKLFMEEEQITQNSVSEFKSLMLQERSLLSGNKRFAPSRHNRFGTMVNIVSNDGQSRTVTGQEVIHSTERAISYLDRNKKWNKPKHRGKRDPDKERDSVNFNKHITLNASARKHLKRFVSEFLDSSFNPLFSHLRKAIEREDERVRSDHSMHFFYLIGWFLQAECARRQYRETKKAESVKGKERRDAPADTQDDLGFGLVASVLNQETFVLLNRYMESAQDSKEWKELNAGMKCFTNILLTVQQMAASENEEDLEIAENIQNRIFYEESTHDRVIGILKGYKDQGLGYLDACTELAHVFIRMLENYSKENADLQIRSRRRQRRKKKAAQEANGDTTAHDNDDDTNDVEQVQIVSRERKFDFTRFVARFLVQGAINTFVSFTKYYSDLTSEQLKRSHRFFYRVAFKNELSVMLFRVDIIQLFHKMIQGPEGLDPEAPYYEEWRTMTQQLFRKLTHRLQDRPGLAVEMLFSKMSQTVFFLEHGYDNVVLRAPRPPAELEVRSGMDWDQQIGVAVSILINQSKSDALAWMKKVLADARDERQTWKDADEARRLQAIESEPPAVAPEDDNDVQPTAEIDMPLPPTILVKADNEERKTAMFKDNKLRLLMTLAGFVRLGDADDTKASWIIPSTLTADKLDETARLIGKCEFDPPVYEEGKAPEEFVRSKAAGERVSKRIQKAHFDDDSDNGIDDDDVELDMGEYGAGGPTERRSGEQAEKKTSTRRLTRRPRGSEGGDPEEEPAAILRKLARRMKKKMEEKQKFKSTIYVHDSDDETDEEKDSEFFAEEERRRTRDPRIIGNIGSQASGDYARIVPGKKRKSQSPGADSSADERETVQRKKAKKSPQREEILISSDSSSSDGESEVRSNAGNEEEMTDTPISSQVFGQSPIAEVQKPAAEVLEEEEEDDVPVRKKGVPRRRGGFIIDSDDED